MRIPSALERIYSASQLGTKLPLQQDGCAPGNPFHANFCCNTFRGTFGFQGSLPTAKYIIKLGVMPDWAFAGHPSPGPLTPRTLCQTMAVTKEERTRLLCLGWTKLLG